VFFLSIIIFRITFSTITMTVHQRSKQWLWLLLFLTTTTLNLSHGLPRLFGRKNGSAVRTSVGDMDEMVPPSLLGEEDDELQIDYTAQAVATIHILYGTSLLLYGKDFPEQVLVLTMMRATGFNTIDTAIRTARKNYRRAMRFAIWRAPSFLKMRKSILDIHNRIDDAKREMAATKRAKQDGIITPREEFELKRMHKRDIRLLRRDRARIQRGMINLGKFIQVLNLPEFFGIIRSFLFQLLAVLASGHSSNSSLCTFITSWCHFLSLGSLLIDGIQNLLNPIIERRNFIERMRKKSKITIGFLGKTGIMMFTFYLSKTYTDFSRRLNAALLASAIILRGFRNFVDAVWDRDEETALAKLALQLEKTAGGLLLVLLTLVGLYCTSLESMWMPRNLLVPMEVIERGIISLVDNLMY
jgi:hypothetical protein